MSHSSGRLTFKALGSATLLALIALFTVLALAPQAGAQQDNFLNGNGSITGTTTFGNATYVPNAVAPVSGAVAAGATSLTMGTVRNGSGGTSGTHNVGFANNRLVMIYQTNGWGSTPTSGSQSDASLSSSTPGHWEFARISTVSGSTLNFTNPLIYAYSSGNTQVIAVPEYVDVSVNNAAARINAPSWDGTSGGVLVMLATGTVSVTSGAQISANGLGFRGGQSYVENNSTTDCPTNQMNTPSSNFTGNNSPYGMKGEGFYVAGYRSTTPANASTQQGKGNYLNAGGGGNCFNAGGGGGSNAALGGTGGNSLVNYTNGNQAKGGLGGTKLAYSASEQIALGGGGGAGERNNAGITTGGAGGGVVMLRGDSLTGSGAFSANGTAGSNGAKLANQTTDTDPPDGSGGGGAGGVVSLRFTGSVACTSAAANGGKGGDNREGSAPTYDGYEWTPGGGGSGGKTYVQGSSVSCSATSSAGAVGTNVTTGQAYGATAGGAESPTTNSSGTSLPVVAISTPANGSSTNDRTPDITGTATSGSTVSIWLDGSLLATVTATGGNWTYTPGSNLSVASHTIRVYSTVAGLSSNDATSTFTIDTTAPSQPTITAPNTTYVGTTTPTVAGAAESGSTVKVYDASNNLLGSGTASSGAYSFATNALTDGTTYVIHVTATDAAGNVSTNSATKTFTVDVTGPTVTFTAPTGTVGPSGNATFTVTDAKSGVNTSQTKCKVDGGSYTSCSSPYAYSGLSDGAHTITVSATDNVGNVSTTVRNFTVDATPPDTNITSNPNALTNSTSAVFGFTSTEGSSTFQCKLDGGSYSSCTSTKSYSSLSPGSHTFYVYATDQYGNVDATPATYTWTIDTTAPSPPVINMPVSSPSYYATTSVTISGTAEANSTVTLYDGASPLTTTVAVDGSGNWSYDATLDEGSHPITAYATDGAGNVSTASGTKTITVDLTTPQVSISAVADGSTINDNTPNFSFSVTEQYPDTLECKVDDGSYATCASGFPLAVFDDGVHTVTVKVTDLAGNVGTASTTFTVDTVVPDAPSITLDSPASSPTQSTDAQISYSGIEPDATKECKLDGGSWTACDDSPVSLSGLSEGTHTYSVRQTDLAGNTSDAGSVTWVVDHTAPDAPNVTLNSPASSPTQSTSAEVAYSGIEPNATTECKLDDGDWGTCDASPVSLSGLAEGSHTYYVRQTDEAGNTSEAGSVTWVIDLTSPDAPNVTLNSPTSSPTQQTSAEIAFSGIEPNATTECKVNEGNWVSCPTSPVELTSLPDGDYTFYVRQTDEAGNVSEAGSVSWTIDTTAPTGTTIDSPSDGDHTSSTTPDFSGKAEAGSSVTVYEGGTEICSTTADQNGDWSCTAGNALSEGDHTFHAVATDAAGNESDSSNEVTLTIDTTNPGVTISAPVDSSTVTTRTPTVTFTIDEPVVSTTCKVDGGTPVSCSSGFVTASLADGSHTVVVTATDAAGNVGTATVTFNVDATAPDTTIDTHPPAFDNHTDASFTFSADDNGATFECNLDNGGWTTCTSPLSFSSLGEGEHTLQVRGTDSNGNVENPPASYTWTVDLTPPADPTISAPIDGSTITTDTPTITGKADPGSKVTVTIDGQDFGPVTADVNGDWSYPASHLDDGEHTVSAIAKDDAGNSSGASADVTFTIDTTPPDGSVVAQTGTGVLPFQAPTFDISSDDGDATTECAIDGGSKSACSSPFTPSGSFTPGTHTLVVTFTDSHGNVSHKTIVFVVAGASEPICLKTGIAISNLAPSGNKVTLSGFARLSYAGQTVSVTYKPTGKVVGTAKVAADGSFVAKFKAPKKKLWLSNKSLYQASVGTEKTTWTKLSRRVASSSASYAAGKLTVKGLLSKPLFPKAKATITARTGCGDPFTNFASVKIKSNGTFSVTAPFTPSSGVIFVKVAAVVSKGGKKPKALRTYSFVMPVVVK